MKKFKGCHVIYLIISLLFVAAGIVLFPNLTNLGWGEKLLDEFCSSDYIEKLKKII